MMLFAPIQTKIETRAAANGSVVVSGSFAYGTTTTLAKRNGRELREVFAPHAFEFDHVDLLSQHSYDRPLASTDAGTLTLRNTDQALTFEARIAPDVAGVTYARDALALIRSGLARGLSPGFVVDDDDVTDAGTATVRTVRHARLHELSIVTRAAYPAAQVEARNWATEAGVIGFPKRQVILW